MSASATSVRRNQTVVTYDPARASAADLCAAIAGAGSYRAELLDGPEP